MDVASYPLDQKAAMARSRATLRSNSLGLATASRTYQLLNDRSRMTCPGCRGHHPLPAKKRHPVGYTGEAPDPWLHPERNPERRERHQSPEGPAPMAELGQYLIGG